MHYRRGLRSATRGRHRDLVILRQFKWVATDRRDWVMSIHTSSVR